MSQGLPLSGNTFYYLDKTISVPKWRRTIQLVRSHFFRPPTICKSPMHKTAFFFIQDCRCFLWHFSSLEIANYQIGTLNDSVFLSLDKYLPTRLFSLPPSLDKLTSHKDLSQAFHECDVDRAQHVLAGQPRQNLRLCAFHHQHTVSVHSAHIEMIVPRTNADAARSSRLTPYVVGDEATGSERYIHDWHIFLKKTKIGRRGTLFHHAVKGYLPKSL